MFHLRLLGGASLDGPTGPVNGRAVQRRRLALLALLAGGRGRGVTRDKLVAYLWPDSETERARHLLSDSLYRINQAMGGDAVLATGDELRLNADLLRCDVVDFRDAVARREWERAATSYAGPFLDGFHLAGADEFERWVGSERDALALDRTRALEALASAAEERGDHTGAVRWARALAVHDPLSSRVALRLMRALAAAGDPAAAIQHARVHGQLVRGELDAEPDPAVAQLVDRLRDVPPVPPPPTAAAVSPERVELRPANAPDVPAAAVTPVPEGEASPPPSPAPAGPTRPAVATPPSQAPPAPLAPLASLAESRRPRRLRRRYAVAAALGALALVVLLAVRGRRVVEPNVPTAVAVLPLADLSSTHDQEYLADGITEELIARLSQVEGLSVVGRTSAFALKGSTSDVREIGTRLGVSAVLSGSVRRADNRLRVVVQLVNASSGYQIWSETYERELADVFAVQDEIARAVVTRLRGAARAGPGGPDAAGPEVADTDDPEAYNLYLRGRFEWHRRTAAGLRAAVRYFRLATERAPEYARAYNGLADAYAVLGFYEYMPPGEAFPRAARAAREALRIRPDLAGAHATLGYVALYYEWDWARAEAEFRRAIELDPSYSTGRQWYANYLTAAGRFDEAVRQMRAAQELDPLSLIANAALGWTYYNAGEPRRAIDQLTRTLEIDAGFELAYLWRSFAHEELAQHAEQVADAERAMSLSGGSAISTAALSRALALAGQPERARATLRALEARPGAYLPAYDIAKAYAALGENATAIRWLERAHAQRSHSMVLIAVDPQLAALRGEPGYQRLVRDLRFPPTAVTR